LNELNERSIWAVRQNNPELVVQDCKRAFGLSEEQCDELRFILLKRGVNKWLLARRRLIALKHEVKGMLKEAEVKSERWKLLQFFNERLQNIARMPRWVEFPKTTTHNWRDIEKRIIVKGRHC